MAGVTLLYFAAAKCGLLFAAISPSATPVWPPTGIAFVACLLLGLRAWPTIFLGAFLANVTIAGSVATSLAIATGNTLEALIGVLLVVRFANGPRVFDRARGIFVFVGVAALASTAVSATIGVTSLSLGGYARWADYGPIWMTWWLGDATGDLIFAPLLLLWARSPRLGWRREQIVEGALLLGALVIIGIGVFAHPSPFGKFPFSFLCLVPLLWSAFRFGPRETAAGTVLTSSIAVWGLVKGLGPMPSEVRNVALLEMQTFMATISVTALGAATLAWNAREAEASAVAAAADRKSLYEQEHAARETATALAALAVEINASLDLDIILQRVVHGGRRLLAADLACIALREGDGFVFRYTTGHRSARWLTTVVRPGRGMGGVALATGQSVSTQDYEADRRFTGDYLDIIREEGIVAQLVVPISHAGEVLGLFYVSNRSARPFIERDEAVCGALAAHAAIAIRNSQLYQSERIVRAGAEQAARRATLLADASALVGSSRDYVATLGDLPSILVPAFADWVVVYLARRDRAVQRVPMRYADPVKQTLADDLARAAPQYDWAREEPPLMAALSERRPVLVSDSADVLTEMIGEESYRRLVVERLRPRSLIVVPLVARGLTVGAIILLTTEQGRRYTDADLRFAEDLASRLASAVDNTRLLRAAEDAGAEARRANEAKDVFLAMLAHELRNPLGAIVSAANVLDKMERHDDAVAVRARDIVKRQTRHLARMVDDLLDLTRVMTGKIALWSEPLDLAEIAAQAVAMLRAAGQLEQHDVTVCLAPAWVHADRTRLHQVVVNLLTNAVKYTPPGGTIWLETGVSDEREVELSVRDTGIGMGADLLPRIFDVFTQGERQLDRRQGGLGIGLALVKRLVEQHGGRVEARSEGPGRGAEFIVRLPRSEPIAPGQSAPPDQASASPRCRVVIIEDNDDIRDMVRAVLSLDGHEVHEAGDGESGVELALRVKPDITLVDLGLPGVDGYEVARRLKAAGHAGRLIALTGYGQAEDRRRSEEVGFQAHLVKPVDEAALLRLLRA